MIFVNPCTIHLFGSARQKGNFSIFIKETLIATHSPSPHLRRRHHRTTTTFCSRSKTSTSKCSYQVDPVEHKYQTSQTLYIDALCYSCSYQKFSSNVDTKVPLHSAHYVCLLCYEILKGQKFGWDWSSGSFAMAQVVKAQQLPLLSCGLALQK